MNYAELTCSFCGKTFTRRNARIKGNGKIYCSVDCRIKANPRKLSTYKCNYCGKIFRRYKSLEAKNQRNFYCSRECSGKAQTGDGFMGGSIYVNKKCSTCGTIVTRRESAIKVSGNVYCSKECSDKSREKPPDAYICGYCGKEFLSKNKRDNILMDGKHYCSATCQFEDKKNQKLISCAHCGKEFYIIPARMCFHKNFCSRGCASAYYKGKPKPAISIALKGRPSIFKGKSVWGEEQRKHFSDLAKQRWDNDEYRERMSSMQKGRPNKYKGTKDRYSEEILTKMKNGAKEKYRKRGLLLTIEGVEYTKKEIADIVGCSRPLIAQRIRNGVSGIDLFAPVDSNRQRRKSKQ